MTSTNRCIRCGGLMNNYEEFPRCAICGWEDYSGNPNWGEYELPRYVTIDEAAPALGYKPHILRALIKRGEIRGAVEFDGAAGGYKIEYAAIPTRLRPYIATGRGQERSKVA